MSDRAYPPFDALDIAALTHHLAANDTRYTCERHGGAVRVHHPKVTMRVDMKGFVCPECGTRIAWMPKGEYDRAIYAWESECRRKGVKP